MTLIHAFLTIITLGLWIIVPLIRGASKGKITTTTDFICMDCGTKQ